MRGEFYFDYARSFRVEFEIVGQDIRCNLYCDTNTERLSQTALLRLKESVSIEYDRDIDVFRFKINGETFVDVSRKTAEIKYWEKLTTFETRMIAQGKKTLTPFSLQTKPVFPKTDLHTHFAGAISVNSLIEVGLKHNIHYPAKLLESIGINTSAYRQTSPGNIALKDLTAEDLEVLKEHLKLPTITQETFNKMEEIYSLRGPFTKNKSLFPEYLRSLAKEYRATGVEYVELSFSAFMTDPDYMQMLEDYIPVIEKETGVKIRFLAGLWRHSDKEWNLDEIDRIQTIAKSPYIVGCDFMGHETNASLDFEEELRMLARYSMLNDPNFAIRIHAGENPMFKTNVYDALKVIYDEHAKLEEENQQSYPMPQVRIGHGLYGLDITSDGKWNNLEPNAVLNLAKEMGAIVEFNMSSNLALNNINSLTDVPIKKYVDAGVKVVLGTDGHGLYSTTNVQEVILAITAGLTGEDLQKIADTEKNVMQRAKERELSHPNIKNVPELYSTITYSTSDHQPRYNKAVEEKYRKQNEELLKTLDEELTHVGAIVDKDIIEQVTAGKTPIMITGASKSNWPNISKEDQELIALTMQVLANVLNPATTYIITGGTNFGVEKTMHEAVHRKNSYSDNPIVLLGTLTVEAVKKGAGEIEPNTITHATILEINGRKAKTWMDLPDTQLVLVQERGGQMIAVGGGGVVNDMIQRAHNLGVNMHLMKGPYGASTKKCESLHGNDYAFTSIKDLLTRLYKQNANYFSSSFSLDNVEEYIEVAKSMIELDQKEELIQEEQKRIVA